MEQRGRLLAHPVATFTMPIACLLEAGGKSLSYILPIVTIKCGQFLFSLLSKKTTFLITFLLIVLVNFVYMLDADSIKLFIL